MIFFYIWVVIDSEAWPTVWISIFSHVFCMVQGLSEYSLVLYAISAKPLLARLSTGKVQIILVHDSRIARPQGYATFFYAKFNSDVVFIMLINVKKPTIVDILTFMSRINFVLSWVEHKTFYNLEAWLSLIRLLLMVDITTRWFFENVMPLPGESVRRLILTTYI